MIHESSSLQLGPVVTYRLVSATREQTLDGPTGVVRATVEIATHSLTLDNNFVAVSEAVRLKVKTLFKGGLMPGQLLVLETLLRDETDDYTQPEDSSDLGTFTTTRTYLFRHHEPLA